MDFTLPEHIETLRLKTRDFVNQKIIPLESDIASYDKHENICLLYTSPSPRD